MDFKRIDKGLAVSSVVHAALLLAALVSFADAKKFDDATEAVPVEVITDAQFKEMTRGDAMAREVKVAPKAQKQSALVEVKPDTPTPEARTEAAATPPPALKHLPDPGTEDVPEPPRREAALPPPPPPVPQPRPEPPKLPVEAVVPPPVPQPRPEPPKAPPPPPKAEKPPPPDEEDKPEAEVVAPKPPPRPVAAKAVDVPAPPRKVRPISAPPKVAEKPPEPVKTPEPPKPPVAAKVPEPAPKPPAPVKTADAGKTAAKPDALAKFLDQKKAEEQAQPAPRPKAAEPADTRAPPDFNAIRALLNKDKPAQKAGSAPDPVRTASLGTPAATQARMSPSQNGELGEIIKEHYRHCWNTSGLNLELAYTAQVAVQFSPQGTVVGTPTLKNPSADPREKAIGESALRAVRSCGPVPVPARLVPFYDEWKLGILRLKPEDS